MRGQVSTRSCGKSKGWGFLTQTALTYRIVAGGARKEAGLQSPEPKEEDCSQSALTAPTGNPQAIPGTPSDESWVGAGVEEGPQDRVDGRSLIDLGVADGS